LMSLSLCANPVCVGRGEASKSRLPSVLRLKGMGTGLDQQSVLERVAAGDGDAVNECIDRYGGLVWSLARRLCPDRSEAEDVVQEIFVSVWSSAKRYDPGIGSEATFIATIARRRLIDRARKRGRTLGAAPLDESYAEPARPAAEPGTKDRGEAVAAEAALRELSEEQQRVLRMSIMHGLSHEQISRATDLPLGTVKTHIRRGLIRIRKKLDESGVKADQPASAGGPGSKGRGVSA